jgi:hypothetical protein
MSRILIVDIDSKIPNIALMKISAWHKAHGDTVGFDIQDPDKVYISCIFKKNADQARGVATYYPDAQVDIGGCGISLSKELPLEIEMIKPDYDLYPSQYSQGYTTRGCIRKCPFCIVPEKEGKIKEWQHPSEFHDLRFDTCMIMDNNLFAAPDAWQKSVYTWFIDNKIKMLSPQGWDVRLLTPDRAKYLKSIKKGEYRIHFAWDDIKIESAVERGIQMLKDAGFNLNHDISFYVLVGYNSTFEEDVYRCNKLRDWGVASFVMPYKKNKQINALARWANRQFGYWKIPFKDYTRRKA